MQVLRLRTRTVIIGICNQEIQEATNLFMDKHDAIRTYIQEQMPTYKVNLLPPRGVRPFGFLMERDGNEYTVEFEEEFVDQRQSAEILKALEDWRVLADVCQGEGLRYVVTSRGLRLDSSN